MNISQLITINAKSAMLKLKQQKWKSKKKKWKWLEDVDGIAIIKYLYYNHSEFAGSVFIQLY